jgi:hypothetical protein
MARSMLGHNLDSIQPDGTILPANGEQSRPDEPGHAPSPSGNFTAPPARPRSRASISSTSPRAASPRRCSPSPPPKTASPTPRSACSPSAPPRNAIPSGNASSTKPAAHRQAAAPPQRLRQPLAGVQRRQGRRALQLRPLQERRNLAPDRAHVRSHRPDQLQPAFSTTPPPASAAISISTA